MVIRLYLFLYSHFTKKHWESDHIILEFSIMQAKATEHSQIGVSDFKRAYFNKLREITKDSKDGNPRRNSSGCMGNSEKQNTKGPNKNNFTGKEKPDETNMVVQRALLTN